MPLEVQPKLLRVLQEREFERLGSTRTQRVDVRLIAATNRDLEAMVTDGLFRRDLYYRLNVFPLHVPPLRERPDDIPALVRYFVSRFSRRFGRRCHVIPETTMDALRNATWSGNIRELEHLIERSVILSTGAELKVPLSALEPVASDPMRAQAARGQLRQAERQAILDALRATGGVVSGPDGAAAKLGVKRTTLQSKMRKLGILRPPF